MQAVRWGGRGVYVAWGLTLVLGVACDGETSGEDAGTDGATADGAVICSEDVDCSDGLFCSGVERCRPEEAGAGADGCVAGNSPCGEPGACDEDQARCVDDPCAEPDADGDGVDRITCGGDDCDDDDPLAYPGNIEICDAEGRDEDCDPLTLGPDGDGDGFVSDACCNTGPDGRVCGRDCDDEMSTVSPTATESCNRVDEDCDDRVDEGTLSTFYEDMDGDDFGRLDVTMEGCVLPAGYADGAGDCDDTDVSVFPGATEICNGEDTDCNGTQDDAAGGCACTIGTPPRACGWPDGMGGFETRGECASGLQPCVDGIWAACEGATLPSAETCDNLNEDCDDAIDEDASDRLTYYRDMDSDGFGDMSVSLLACPADAPSGYTTSTRFDCDDDDANRDPDETETCDGVDEDCDTMTDEAPASLGCGNMAGHTYACMSGGMCAISGCPSGTDDCNDDHLDGCEESLSGNDDACGACGNRCDLDCVGTSCDDIVAVEAGNRHACGIRSGGAVVCWGDNDQGQLGDGTTIRRADPRPVAVIASVSSVSAGNGHTCSIQAGGRAFCWGGNGRGQVGRPASASPEQVPREVSLSGVTHIAAGNQHTCAITGSGELWCWGRNNRGQLGDGGTGDTHLPRAVRDPDGGAGAQITDAIGLAAGANHSCAIRSGGAVVCWGQNDQRQLGDDVANHGDSTCAAAFVDCSRVPVSASGLSNAVTLSASGTGAHTCVLTGSGEVRCWGQNDVRQSADSATAPTATPTLVVSGADEVSAGTTLSCARLSSGPTHCWGDNDVGQLGRGGTSAPSGPGAVMSLPDASDVTAGNQFACAVRTSGPTVCWGSDALTQLGDGDPVMNSSSPVVVSRLP